MKGEKYTFKVHDGSVNTYGFRMLTEGCDLSEYEKNPNVFLNHRDFDLPIGRGENVRKEDGAILVDVVFDTDDPRAAEVAGKVERGFLRMASVGTWPPERVSDDESLRLPGQTGPTVTRWTLREVSICAIGANHNALAMYDRDGKRVELGDPESIIRLTDGISKPINKNKRMSIVTQLLKLSDSASEQAVGEELKKRLELAESLKTENERLEKEKKTLTDRIGELEESRKKEEKAKAARMVESAIKEGRIDASGREVWLSDFAADYGKAEQRLKSIPPRKRLAAVPEPDGGNDKPGSASLADMTFTDILKADRLRELKRDKELYRSKFREAYGHYPA